MRKIFVLFIMLLLPSVGLSQEIGAYLILNDIGEYIFRPKRIITIQNAGILVSVGHFPGHGDTTYEGIYIHPQTYLGVSVQVTQHAGSDSDRWLEHEVDAEFRDYYGIPDLSFTVRNIDGNTVFVFASGGRDYRWISGNKVVMVEYTALEMSKKPEPIEIVRAYLAKHPSALPSITLRELRSGETKTKWIKDEMERRLWLSDKWFLQIQMGKAEADEALQVIVKSMSVFLDYREKYYNISAKGEKELLSGYLEANDGAAIKNKLTEYKKWWAANKGRTINLP